MKTALVAEIKNDYAIVILNNSDFLKVKKENDWKVGDIVYIKISNKNKITKQFLTIAASLVLIISLSLFYQGTFLEARTFLNIDINPSLEIVLNKYDRVINIKALNDDADKILESFSYKNQKYDKVIRNLINRSNENKYSNNDSYIYLTVKSAEKDKEEYIKNFIESEIKIEENYNNLKCYSINDEIESNAKMHGVSPARYMVLEELLEADPQAKIEDYKNESYENIHNHMEHCQNIPSQKNSNQENQQSCGMHGSNENINNGNKGRTHHD